MKSLSSSVLVIVPLNFSLIEMAAVFIIYSMGGISLNLSFCFDENHDFAA